MRINYTSLLNKWFSVNEFVDKVVCSTQKKEQTENNVIRDLKKQDDTTNLTEGLVDQAFNVITTQKSQTSVVYKSMGSKLLAIEFYGISPDGYTMTRYRSEDDTLQARLQTMRGNSYLALNCMLVLDKSDYGIIGKSVLEDQEHLINYWIQKKIITRNELKRTFVIDDDGNSDWRNKGRAINALSKFITDDESSIDSILTLDRFFNPSKSEEKITRKDIMNIIRSKKLVSVYHTPALNRIRKENVKVFPTKDLSYLMSRRLLRDLVEKDIIPSKYVTDGTIVYSYRDSLTTAKKYLNKSKAGVFIKMTGIDGESVLSAQSENEAERNIKRLFVSKMINEAIENDGIVKDIEKSNIEVEISRSCFSSEAIKRKARQFNLQIRAVIKKGKLVRVDPVMAIEKTDDNVGYRSLPVAFEKRLWKSISPVAVNIANSVYNEYGDIGMFCIEGFAWENNHYGNLKIKLIDLNMRFGGSTLVAMIREKIICKIGHTKKLSLKAPWMAGNIRFEENFSFERKLAYLEQIARQNNCEVFVLGQREKGLIKALWLPCGKKKCYWNSNLDMVADKLKRDKVQRKNTIKKVTSVLKKYGINDELMDFELKSGYLKDKVYLIKVKAYNGKISRYVLHCLKSGDRIADPAHLCFITVMYEILEEKCFNCDFPILNNKGLVYSCIGKNIYSLHKYCGGEGPVWAQCGKLQDNFDLRKDLAKKLADYDSCTLNVDVKKHIQKINPNELEQLGTSVDEIVTKYIDGNSTDGLHMSYTDGTGNIEKMERAFSCFNSQKSLYPKTYTLVKVWKNQIIEWIQTLTKEQEFISRQKLPTCIVNGDSSIANILFVPNIDNYKKLGAMVDWDLIKFGYRLYSLGVAFSIRMVKEYTDKVHRHMMNGISPKGNFNKDLLLKFCRDYDNSLPTKAKLKPLEKDFLLHSAKVNYMNLILISSILVKSGRFSDDEMARYLGDKVFRLFLADKQR